MKLYKISQSVNSDWDTYDSAVVAAVSATAARRTNMGSARTWATEDKVTAKYLGEAKRGTKVGVICASFNAG